MGARRGARPEERLKSTHAQQAQKPKPKKAVCVELDFGFGLGLLSVFLCTGLPYPGSCHGEFVFSNVE